MRSVTRRLCVAVACAVLLMTACAPSEPAPVTTPTPTASAVDYGGLETAIEKSITSGSAVLDNVRAVLVVVDGETKIAHYRHGFGGDDHAHIFSVTKSVVATLIGIAVAEGLISDLDAPLSELLPEYRQDMTSAVEKVNLRDLLTMSGGFGFDLPEKEGMEIATGKRDLVTWAVSAGQQSLAGIQFRYSNVSAHLAGAVLLSALQRNESTKGQTILDYARSKLFDPLGIQTTPAYEKAPITDTAEFERAGFGWIRVGDLHLGGFGLRLTVPDMAKLGQLYLDDGVWQGGRILPEGWVQEATGPSPIERGYGLFWWRDDQWGMPLYEARGAGGQRIAVIPDRRVVIVTVVAVPPEGPIDDEGIDPLVNDVILRALQ